MHNSIQSITVRNERRRSGGCTLMKFPIVQSPMRSRKEDRRRWHKAWSLKPAEQKMEAESRPLSPARDAREHWALQRGSGLARRISSIFCNRVAFPGTTSHLVSRVVRLHDWFTSSSKSCWWRPFLSMQPWGFRGLGVNEEIHLFTSNLFQTTLEGVDRSAGPSIPT